MNDFLPISRSDVEERSWDRLDFIVITGDAYVDHPSFGAAIISRLLEAEGFRVGVIARPDHTGVDDFRRLGKPRLAFLITSGNIDSMVNNYTVAKKRRTNDVYAPGGIGGGRPDRAAIVYAVRAREAFKGVPIILGGLEASLRRLAYYDYWSDRLRRSILLDSKADLLVYGMGERQIVEIASRLAAGEAISTIRDIRGTAYLAPVAECPEGAVMLPDFDVLEQDRRSFAESFRLQHGYVDAPATAPLVEPYGKRVVVQNPAALPLGRDELDRIYSLPYRRTWHPIYAAAGGVPAIEEVRFSITATRGCYGGCGFCALTYHQGRSVTSRSRESILAEARALIALPDFKGYIHDVGGPTANFLGPACRRMERRGPCPDRLCLVPERCDNLVVDHREFLGTLRALRELPGVKKVFIRSGIRFDYLMADQDGSFFDELVGHHVSGQLKVAPEHVDLKVLRLMRKPPFEVYRRFEKRFAELNQEHGKKQFLVPYYISSHPGSDLRAAIALAEHFRDMRFAPDQVQDFYPTPGTLSTCMYYTGLDPTTMEEVYVPRSLHEKAMQRALMHFRKPQNHALVHEALVAAGRTDLIGRSAKCLIPLPVPRRAPTRR